MSIDLLPRPDLVPPAVGMPPEPAAEPLHDVVARLVDGAAGGGASDLFFCTNEDHVAVLARHLGVLRTIEELPTDDGRRCIAHVKTMAGLEATERRHPLDGRWVHRRDDGTAVDLRVETVPTLYGEDVAVRLFVRGSRFLRLDALGLAAADVRRLRALLQAGGGLILVSGPGGSGKTTTLYAMVADLANGDRKINTIEDPIEYALPGVRQSQVNPRIGLDFPDLLRAVLRQGADVIMVGEVRDPVTAQAAVRAANSGHVVLATVHAASAAGAVQSMLGFGVPPHHLAGALRAAVAQRLVRTLCRDCKRPVAPATVARRFDPVRHRLAAGQAETPFDPAGCPACRGNGFTGRTGLFEVLPVTDGNRRMILSGEPAQTVHGAAVAAGMIPIHHAGLLKAAAGETSLDEVFRVAQPDTECEPG